MCMYFLISIFQNMKNCGVEQIFLAYKIGAPWSKCKPIVFQNFRPMSNNGNINTCGFFDKNQKGNILNFVEFKI